METLPEIFEAYETGAWVVLSVLVLQVAIKLLKQFKEVWEPAKAYAKPAILVLSAAVGILSAIAGGLSTSQALLVFAANGLSPFLHDLFDHFKLLKEEEAEKKDKD